MAIQKITLSLCEFKDGSFELYVTDGNTGESLQIDGRQKFTDAQRAMLERLMPPCVYTTYEREAL